MTTPPNDDDARQIGAVENGHVLTAAGWMRLRYLPGNANPPYYPGDVKGGHVFTGTDWAPLPAPPPQASPSLQPPFQQPKKKSWLMWVGIGVGIVVLLGIVSAVSEIQAEKAASDRASAEQTRTPSASSTPDRPKEPRKKKAPRPKEPAPPPVDPNTVVIDGMAIHKNFNCSYDGYSSTITGTITNRSGDAKGYVQVSFGLYDSSGALLGTALANVNNLGPGVDWKFKAVGFVSEFETCKVEDLTAY